MEFIPGRMTDPEPLPEDLVELRDVIAVEAMHARLVNHSNTEWALNNPAARDAVARAAYAMADSMLEARNKCANS